VELFSQEKVMLRTILVPLDGSAFAEQALPLALKIARSTKAPINLVRAHVLYALEETGGEWAPRFDATEDAEFRQHEKSYLDEIVRRLTDEHCCQVTCAVTEGLAADAILEQAEATSTDLIVMTTHGCGPLNDVFLGSVADEVVRRFSHPVLLVRPVDAVPDLHREPSVRKMLIPLDLSRRSEQILGPAMHFGSALGVVSYTLMNIVPPDLRPAPRTMTDRTAGLNRSFQEHQAEIALAYLDQVAERLRIPSIEVKTHVVIGQHAASSILAQAHAESYGLIALATHGRGRFKKLLLGSVADKVVRGALCPILLYRGPAQ
jgi:nucleotide-binding universal stress UspA family protein